MKFATVISTHTFDAKADRLLSADERANLEFALAKDPEAHPIIPGLNGVRKARFGKQETGKRGGVRVIYFYAIVAGDPLEQSERESIGHDAVGPRVRSVARHRYKGRGFFGPDYADESASVDRSSAVWQSTEERVPCPAGDRLAASRGASAGA